MVQKGKVSAVLDGGRAVTVTPYVGSTVTTPITVPETLVDVLPVGTPVIFVVFDDNTGLVIARMDGQTNQSLRS